MKKISLLIFILVSLFVFTGNVFALTCSYNNYSNTYTSNKISVSYEIDSNGEITKVEGLPIKGTQYNKVKSQIASSGTCPLYAFVGNDGLVYLYYDKAVMLEEQSKFGKEGLNSTVDDSIKKSSEETLNKLSVFCNGVAATTYDYTKCWDEDKFFTKYAECQSEVEKLGMYLRSTRSEVRSNAQSGYLDPNSKAFTDMEKVCAAAEKNVENYEEALKYKSCNEYKKAVGGKIECKEDVENNPYVNEQKNSESKNVESKDNCGGIFGSIDNKENFAYYLYHAFQIMKFLGPILVVVMSILDLVKITADPKQDDQLQKLGFKTLKRLVFAALIFILPDLINYLFGLVGLYGTCGIY